MNNHEIILSFRILCLSITPEVATKALGITPSKVGLKGEPVKEGLRITHNASFWEISSECNSTDELLLHVESIIYKLKQADKDILEKICNEESCNLSCALYLNSNREESIPYVNFDREQTKFFASLGAEIDIDIYLV